MSFKHKTTHKPNSHQRLDAGSVRQIPPPSQCESLGGGEGLPTSGGSIRAVLLVNG